MQIDIEKIVHEYDLRGIYPGEITPELFRNIGIAIGLKYNPRNVAVGYDVRESSILLMNELISGLASTGTDVYKLGLISTEIINFVSGFYPEIDIAAVVTASHNPKEYNGLKLVGKNAQPISKQTGMYELVQKALANPTAPEKTPGKVSELIGFWESYRDSIFAHTGVDKLTKEIHLMIDAGNGVGGYAYEKIMGDVTKVIPHLVNAFPNGEFPFHEANPAKSENLVEITRLVKESPNQHDIGIAFDADADRIVFIDSAGEIFHPHYLGILLSEHFLQTTDKNILYDSRLRLAFRDLAEKYPNRVIVNKPGRTNFYANLRDKNAVFALEASGHFFFSDSYNSDSAMFTLGHILKLLDNGVDLTNRQKELAQKYWLAGEVSYTVDNADNLIAKVKESFASSDLQVTEIDGLEVTAADWGMSLRKSNTQPLVRLNVEGRSKSVVIEKFRLFEGAIGGIRENKPILPELI
jgi:phosphomannomutase